MRRADQYSTSEWYRKQYTEETKDNESGTGNSTLKERRTGWAGYGHVTPSFRTDDKIESQSNFNLQVSLI